MPWKLYKDGVLDEHKMSLITLQLNEELGWEHTQMLIGRDVECRSKNVGQEEASYECCLSSNLSRAVITTTIEAPLKRELRLGRIF